MRLQLLQLPADLREVPQWAASTLTVDPTTGKPDKSPRHPFTSVRVSSTDPTGWVEFLEAANTTFPAVGFITTPDDPFVFIDLDRKEGISDEELAVQERILGMFDSYTEYSQSGKGLHIILRGKIGGGLRRGAVEVYDQERYMICTGNVFKGGPIRSHPELLAQLVAEMGGIDQGSAEGMGESGPELHPDAEILDRARSQKNGEKFSDLYDREPQTFEDWSQRDAALVQMLVFHTRNHDQLMRLFQGSKLYRPHGKTGMNPQQYHETYLKRHTFARALAAERQRDANIEHGRALVAPLVAALTKPAATQVQKASITFPPGLIGEVAQFILHAAPRPIPEVALAGALTFCAGVMGRQFQYGGQGLNVYLVLVAPTGAGKDGASGGISKLMSSCMTTVPSIIEFRGAARIASGQALFKDLKDKPCHFAINKEFGKTLKLLTNPKASEVHETFKQTVLDLFTQSGRHDVMNGMSYSDREKNVQPIYAPAFTLFGETTPEDYFPIFTQQNVADGFLPRFLTIRYDGDTPYRSKDMIKQPSADLIQKVSDLVVRVSQLSHNQEFCEVEATPDAANKLEEISVWATDINNRGRKEGLPFYQLWNRYELKVQRLSALCAVGRNFVAPIITLEDVQWAERLVREDIEDLLSRVEDGDIGSDETQQESLLIKTVQNYLRMPREKRLTYVKGAGGRQADAGIMPYDYFRRSFRGRKAFDEDRRGAAAAVKAILLDAVERQVLSVLSRDQAAVYGASPDTKLYVAGPNMPIPK